MSLFKIFNSESLSTASAHNNVYFLPASFSLSDEMRKQSLGVFEFPAGGIQHVFTVQSMTSCSLAPLTFFL